MATRHYESSTSGMNFDRFLDKFDESTLVTMKRHYWTAKQLLRTKLGRKEDEYLQASDASLDLKLTLFRSVKETSEHLLSCIENYHGFLLDATLCENELGRYLKDQGKADKREETGRTMIALGRALMFSSHQRAAVRVPLLRFYQELQVFNERAIFDCSQTVEAVERARLEYRGSLLWMKKTSEELDPDTDRQLEKFREAQSAVRANKEKLDKLKVDTLQKDLIEPSKKVARKIRQESLEKEAAREAEYSRLAAEDSEPMTNLVDFDEEPEGSLKKYLFGRESPVQVNHEPEPDRPDSPLGILDIEPETGNAELEQPSKIFIGPLPALIDTSVEVPQLAPPPRATSYPSSSAATWQSPQLEGEASDSAGYSVQDLFPLVGQTSENSSKGGIIDLLSGPTTTFPNPFDEGKASEWDLLLSQCDIQQSNDLI